MVRPSPESGPARGPAPRALVWGECARALGAGLLLQSFSKIVTKDFGLDPDHVTTMSVALTSEQYKEGESVFRLQNQILNSIGSIPKVSSVSIAKDRPFTNSHLYNSFKIFDWYHKGVHPDKINTKEGFSRFLCRSPLYDQKDNYERNKAFRTDKKYDQDREFKDEGVFPAFHGSYHMYHKIDGKTFAIVSLIFVYIKILLYQKII